jgi:hypothetical protein
MVEGFDKDRNGEGWSTTGRNDLSKGGWIDTSLIFPRPS